MTKSIKEYILTEGFETPNQLKMWKDHIDGLKIYNYPLQRNNKFDDVSNNFDLENWEEDWDNPDTPEKVALKDKLYMKGALREETYVVVKDNKDDTYRTIVYKGYKDDEIRNRIKKADLEYIQKFNDRMKADKKVSKLNKNSASNLHEAFAVVRDKKDDNYITYIPLKKGRASEDLDDIRKQGKYSVITYYHDEKDARTKVAELNKKQRMKNKDKTVFDENTQIDELSKPTIANYIRRASKDVAQKGYELGSDGYNKKRDKKLGQRQYNISKAADRLANEEFEQIDELSKDTLKSYLTKAKDDPERYMKAAKASRDTAQDYRDKKRMGPEKYDIAKSYDDRARKLTKKSMNRTSGKIKANKKLASESVDPEAKLKEKISKMNVNQLKDIIKKLNDMHGSDEDIVFDFATAELEKKMSSKEFVKFMNQLDESEYKKLSYDEFMGVGKETWEVEYSGSSGRAAGGQNRKTRITGFEIGSTIDDVKNTWKRKFQNKKFISARKLNESIDFIFPTRDKNKGTKVDSLIITEGKNSNYPITQERAKEIIAKTPFMSSYSKNMTDDEQKAVLDFWLKISSKPNKGHLSFSNVLGMIAKGKKIED